MKLYCFPFLILLVFSCGSNQSASNYKQSNLSNINNINIDCSIKAKTYVLNTYGRANGAYYSSVESVSRQKDGSYIVGFKPNMKVGIYAGIQGHVWVQVWIDEYCKLVSARKVRYSPIKNKP